MAEGHEVFDATIKAVDEATGPIGRIMAASKSLSALFGAMQAHARGMGAVVKAAFGEAEGEAHKTGHAAHEAGEGIKHAGHEAEHAGHEIKHAAHAHEWMALAEHVTLLRGHFGELRASVGEMGGSLSEFLPALAGLGAAGGLVGLFEMTEHASEAFSEMSAAAMQAGVSVQQFAQLGYVAGQTDVSIENMRDSMFKLNRTIGDALAGKNKNALALFHHLNLELKDAHGHVLSAADVLPELAEAFKNTADPTMRARAAMVLFGKAGNEMLPMLMQGKEELEELSRRGAELTYVGTPEEQKGLEEYHRSMMSMSAAVHGLTQEIGAKLAPVLRPVIELATEWIAANRDWIATGLADKVGALAGWIEKLDIRGVIEQTQEWIKSAGELSGHLGGVTTLVGALVLAVGSPLIAGIGAAVTVLGHLAAALRVVSALMMANPWVAAAAAIGLAAYEIYEHWGAVKQFFQDLWAGIAAAFNSGWQHIQPIVDSLKGAVSFVENGWVGRQLGLNDSGHAGGADNAIAQAQSPGGIPALGYAGMPLLGPRNGETHLRVTFDNTPPGTTIRSTTTGEAQRPEVAVGYGLAGVAGAY